MVDTLGELCRRAEARREQWDSIEWSWISVEPEGFARKRSQFIGIARIDHQLFGYLDSVAPRSFRVEPGEHTITVHLYRRFRHPDYPGRVAASLQVTVQPGEHARVSCGVRPEWKRLHAIIWRRTVNFLIGCLFAAGVGWLIVPVLVHAIALPTLRSAIGDSWLSLFDVFASSRGMTMAIVMGVWSYFGSMMLENRNRRLVQGLELQVGKPYYLARKAEGLKKLKPNELSDLFEL